MEAERVAYYALIAYGGRPSHPIHLLRDVLVAPGQYRGILGYWYVTLCAMPLANCVGTRNVAGAPRPGISD